MGYHANELAEIEPVEARSIAKEVFLWGMHPVAIYHFRYNFAQNEKNPRYVGINRLSWDRKPHKSLAAHRNHAQRHRALRLCHARSV